MENVQQQFTVESRELKGTSPDIQWLIEAAARHERACRPVWALLYRQDAYLMEREGLSGAGCGLYLQPAEREVR